MQYQAEGTPLVVFAGKEYGTGSSRDWAAKGTEPAGREGGDRRELRAHPPLQPGRHGRAALQFHAAAESRIPETDRRVPVQPTQDPAQDALHQTVSDTPGTLTFHGDHFSPFTTSQADNPGAMDRETTFTVEARTLTDIIDGTKYKDAGIDLLDVDCEGMDLEVLRSLDFTRYRPKIIAVEIHAASIPEVQASGAHAFLIEQGYLYVNRVGPTSVFLRADLLHRDA
jgi:FkbM family methyltransferase